MRTILLILIYFTISGAICQTQIVHRNSQIEQMVSEISAGNLEKYVRDLAGFRTRHTLSQDDPNEGILASQNYVLDLFRSFEAGANGRLTSEIEFFTIPADGRRIPTDSKLGNIMATLKGSDPNDDRIFIISAHIDSRALDVMDTDIDAPGANDDGSGVAAIIELTRIMSKNSYQATIIFVVVSGEEQGLKGAAYLAEKAKEENWNLVAMLNNDMIGNSHSSETNINDNTRVRIFSEGVPAAETEQMTAIRRYTNAENDSKSRQLARYMKEVGERYVDQLEVKLIYRNDRFLRGGDHTPFAREGFTAVRVTEMNENYYHQHENVRVENGIQYGDLPEFVDFEYVANVARVNAASLASLALAPARPKNAGLVTSKLTNDTELKWDAGAETDLAGYEIVWRDTTSSVWTNSRFVGSRTAFRMPGMSKDNYFFGIRAVDKAGNKSPVSFPKPVR